VLHASPDAPAVDVYVDGTKAITDLAFGSIADYTPVTAGNHAIRVCATGRTGSAGPSPRSTGSSAA